MALTPGYYRYLLSSPLLDNLGSLVHLQRQDTDGWWRGMTWFRWQAGPAVATWPPFMLEEAQAEGRLVPLGVDDYFLAVLAGDWSLAW